MGARSKVVQLPVQVKAWLDQELHRRRFADYEELAELLAERGYKIGKSSVHRYGKALEQRQAAIKAAVDGAKTLVAATGDDQDAMGQALIALVQQKLFDLLLAVEETKIEPAKMSKLTLAVSRLSRASVNQKKWSIEAREKALDDAADAVEQAAQQQGLNKEQAQFWREQVLGVK